jgi:hypothetical protein
VKEIQGKVSEGKAWKGMECKVKEREPKEIE